MAKIQIKRGAISSIPALSVGELYLATDTNEVYIGTSGGNEKIGGYFLEKEDGKIKGLLMYDDVQTISSPGATETLNLGNGNLFIITLDQNCTFSFTAPSKATILHVLIKQSSSGSCTITWPSTVYWLGKTIPTPNLDANGYTFYTFIYTGSDYIGGGDACGTVS